ncbi:hypothetical protein ACFW7J_39390, partial [Streptomyces sp. NPDC059525]
MNPSAPTLALVESPVQLLNVLEWAHTRSGDGGPLLTAVPRQPGPAGDRNRPGPAGTAAARLRILVLPPTDPMSRGQLRRMAGLARGEGHAVHWQEARGGSGSPAGALAALAPAVRRAG